MKHGDYLKKQYGDAASSENYQVERMKAEIAVAIARRREAIGLTQSKAAKLAHLTQQQFSKIEQAENCNIETYLKAMASLEMDLSDLLPEAVG